jgi:hypothetical protein
VILTKNARQTQDQGRRQDLTTDNGYDGTFDVDEQRHPQLSYKTVYYSSLRHEQEKPAAADSLSPYRENRGEEKL